MIVLRLFRALERVDTDLTPQQYRILKLARAGGERCAAPPGLRSEERATREGGAPKRPGGERGAQREQPGGGDRTRRAREQPRGRGRSRPGRERPDGRGREQPRCRSRSR